MFFGKVDCEYKDWGEWGECDQACGGGIQSRTREAARQAWYGGVKCTTEGATETRSCNEDTCPGKILSKCVYTYSIIFGILINIRANPTNNFDCLI